MKLDHLPLAVLDGRHAGALLAHPCPCDHPRCTTIGEHLWWSTRNMTPGPRAQAFEPRTITPATNHGEHDPPPDRTATLDVEYRQLLDDYRTSSQALTRFIDQHRPDRWVELPQPDSDDLWCTNHLERIGVCEPRHRGELCRSCYDIQLTHGTPPDRILLRAMRDRGRITPAMQADFIARIRPRNKAKRKKAG